MEENVVKIYYLILPESESLNINPIQIVFL